MGSNPTDSAKQLAPGSCDRGFCGLMVDMLDNKSTFVDGVEDLRVVQDEFSEYWYSELKELASEGLLSLDVVQKLQRTLCVPFYDAFRFMGVWGPGDYEVGLVCRLSLQAASVYLHSKGLDVGLVGSWWKMNEEEWVERLDDLSDVRVLVAG